MFGLVIMLPEKLALLSGYIGRGFMHKSDDAEMTYFVFTAISALNV